MDDPAGAPVLAAYAALQGRVQAAADALPAPARRLYAKYRRAVELCGRSGPGGCALLLLEDWAGDLAALCRELTPPPGKVADNTTAGPGY